MYLLEKIGDFKGLKTLPEQELPALCAELREMILDVTLKNGGHLGASLGTVELIVALLRAYNPDRDKIIFDVGHQAYAYKILTGRLHEFKSMRTKGGIAGFPRMEESKYDFFTTGHSSTSISAALGYAKARDLNDGDHHVVAVIGDGALLNGVAFEGLNNASQINTKIIIVLNDNKMSISPRIGGMAGHLARIAVNPSYKKLKKFIKSQCDQSKHGESIKTSLSKMKTKLKSLLLPPNIFEEMGISYWGPFDGHDAEELEEVFELAKSYDKPLLLHVITKKGKGCTEAEDNPCKFHGVAPNSKLKPSGKTQSIKPSALSWSTVMARALENIAKEDKHLTVCTAAMTDGTKLTGFEHSYPERFFDVGIAEEHMMIYAAGLAAGGMKSAVCVYSTFLQRAADQIMHDICLPKLPVLIGIDRAGLVGEDGETHHGLFDIAWLRALPNIVFAAPRDETELNYLVRQWHEREVPMAVRYPRGRAPQNRIGAAREPAEWLKLEILSKGTDVCLIGLGSTVKLMIDTAEIMSNKGMNTPTVADLRFIKPMDEEALNGLLSSHKIVVTAEEGAVTGGVGQAIAALASKNNYDCKVINVGVPDRFISHAAREEQWQECGLTSENIISLCKPEI